MNQIGFSVIVPVYKTERYLDKCIESILNQNYESFELILVDDGSPDRCGEICDYYAKQNEKIKVIHKKNGGQASSRNAGIKAASKEYLIFIDSDDYLCADSYLRTIAEFIGSNKVDLLIVPYHKYYEEQGKMEDYVEKGEDIINQPKEKVLSWMVKNRKYIASACDKVVRTNFIKRNNILFLENKKNEDILWSARIMNSLNTMGFVDKSYYIYRQHCKSTTHSIAYGNLNDLCDNIKLCIGIFEKEKNSQLKKIYLSYVAYQYITFFIMIHSIKNIAEKERLINQMKEYIWLLKFDLVPRVKIFKYIQAIVGYKGLLFASKIYCKFFYKPL